MAQQKQKPLQEDRKTDMLFDISQFKADRQRKMPTEARRILTLLPQYRSEKEIHYVSEETIPSQGVVLGVGDYNFWHRRAIRHVYPLANTT